MTAPSLGGVIAWWRGQSRVRRGLMAAISAIGLAVMAAAVSYYAPGVFDRLGGGGDDQAYTVTVEANPDEITTRNGPVGGAYLFAATPIQAVDAPPEEADVCVGRYEWARSHGGVDADATVVRVSVEGRTTDVVQVTGIDIKVLERRPAVVGSHVTCPGRGETPEVRVVSAQLDPTPPEVVTADEDGQPSRFLFTVSQSEVEIFDITALALECDCEWEAELHLVVDGQERRQRINNGGKPFRTSSSANARSYRRIAGGWVDEDTSLAAPRPLPADIGPVADACTPLEPSEVEAVLGQPVTGGPATPYAGPGVLVPIAESRCSFVADTAPPGSLPPGGQTVASVAVLRAAAASGADLEREFDAQLERYAGGRTPRPVSGIGDEAFAVDGVLISRRGAEMLTVQVVAGDGRSIAAGSEETLAAVAAARAWG